MLFHLNIGTNLGDRMANIDRAVAAVSRLGALEVSRPVESEPWGYRSPNTYINIGVNLRTDLSPLALLRATQAIERELSGTAHRHADGSYADREVDIDIIAAEDLALDTPELALPHPRMHLRPFVLRPMMEICPDWRHPRFKMTPSELLMRYAEGQSR